MASLLTTQVGGWVRWLQRAVHVVVAGAHWPSTPRNQQAAAHLASPRGTSPWGAMIGKPVGCVCLFLGVGGIYEQGAGGPCLQGPPAALTCIHQRRERQAETSGFPVTARASPHLPRLPTCLPAACEGGTIPPEVYDKACIHNLQVGRE